MSKKSKGKAQIPSQFNQNVYNSQPGQNQYPTQSSQQHAPNPYYSQQNQNFYHSQQNSNQLPQSQNSNCSQNTTFQQNYNEHQYMSPNSQQRSTIPTPPNLSRNLNTLFGDNWRNDETQFEFQQTPEDENPVYRNSNTSSGNAWGNQQTGINLNAPSYAGATNPPQKAQKMVKWSPDEQAELAHCWVECSRDNKKGTSQSESSFWNSVWKMFNSRSPNNAPRSVDSLKQSWKRINANCQRWKEIMAGLETRQQSGANDVDLFNLANEVYLSEHNNQPFTMHNCYKILAREEKWSNVRQEHSVMRFLPRKNSDESSPGSLDAPQDSPFTTSSGGRPAGKFKAKKKSATDYSPYYEQLNARMVAAEEANTVYTQTKEAKRLERAQEKQRCHDELQQLRNEELELRKQELARQQRADDIALLSCNLNELNPLQRMYMEKQIEEYHRRQGGQ